VNRHTALFAAVCGAAWCLTVLTCEKPAHKQSAVSLADPFIGTGGHGHTFPGATVPFGGVQLSPDTRIEGWDGCSGYHYSDDVVYGFSHTHLSGTGVPDLCDILFMPFSGDPVLQNGYGSSPDSGYASRFSHKKEKAVPGYYSVMLDDYDILAELCAGIRTGMHRYTFNRKGKQGIIIDLTHRDRVIDSGIAVVSDTEIEGYRISSSWADSQFVYFAVRFSRPFTSCDIALNDRIIPGMNKASGTRVKAVVRLQPESVPLEAAVGISAVDIAGAWKNLEEDSAGRSFDAARARADSMWQQALSSVDVTGGTREQRRIFYSALYHCFIAPNMYMDADGRYRGTDLNIHRAEGFTNYTVFSLWDTFRAAHPLYTILRRDLTNDFINTMLHQYKNGGFLPMWELTANYTHCMIGYHAVSAIADAYAKGIRRYDAALALEAMKHSAMQNRFGTDAYRAYGFIPMDREGESVSKTLEYAYDDWCIATMAGLLGRQADHDAYMKRAQYYRNIFDPGTRFMRARANGMWGQPFDPAEVNFNFTEANSWQYSFFAPHDVSGLMDLYGGDDAFTDRLDSLFSADADLTGRHQPDITGLIGQYAHGNEPSHHIAYLYAYAGKPWKTQEKVSTILRTMYTDKPDGLSGNEDCGQMSAWYVMSALGIYPVCPGSPVYVLGAPLFHRAVLHLENEKDFVIITKGRSEKNCYIQSALLNGRPLKRSFLTHDEIMQGGELSIVFSSKPNREWAADAGRPVSAVTGTPITRAPFAAGAGRTFRDSVLVSLQAPDSGAVIHYTLDGTVPGTAAMTYSEPFYLYETRTVMMKASAPGRMPGFPVKAEFTKIGHNWDISLNTMYDSQYTAGGNGALIDNLRGGSDFRTGRWQGYQGRNLDAVIDMKQHVTVTRVCAGFLQDQRSWIWLPKNMTVYISSDGENFSKAGSISHDVPETQEGTVCRELCVSLAPCKARFIRVVAENIGTIPPWHRGAGNQAWVFADEITIHQEAP